jgi:DNA topoisomerase-1
MFTDTKSDIAAGGAPAKAGAKIMAKVMAETSAAEAQLAEVRADVLAHCAAGGLKHVDDGCVGITRKILRGKFAYFDPAGKRIRDEAVIARINALVIPPAYEQVWICPEENGHIQATGRDARGRKQYRYHDQWHAVRDANKYEQLSAFACALPRIRRAIERDMANPGLCQAKVMATVVRLLETTLIRIGTAQYARDNKSFGLTTLKRRHLTLAGTRMRFRFRGKSGVEHDVTVNDKRIARVVKRCMEIGGQTLFHYVDAEEQAHAVDSAGVNAYLKAATGGDFTAKHYRTWAGSVLAMAQLQRRGFIDEAGAKKAVVEVVKDVAARLGNTPAVCRACYIHPLILEHYLAGSLPERAKSAGPRGLSADERRLLAFLGAAGAGFEAK